MRAILKSQEETATVHNRQKRVWLWIATIAIIAALVLMLLPQCHTAHSTTWLAVLPLLILGIITLPRLQLSATCAYSRRAPGALTLPTRFQRPPPSHLA